MTGLRSRVPCCLLTDQRYKNDQSRKHTVQIVKEPIAEYVIGFNGFETSHRPTSFRTAGLTFDRADVRLAPHWAIPRAARGARAPVGAGHAIRRVVVERRLQQERRRPPPRPQAEQAARVEMDLRLRRAALAEEEDPITGWVFPSPAVTPAMLTLTDARWAPFSSARNSRRRRRTT